MFEFAYVQAKFLLIVLGHHFSAPRVSATGSCTEAAHDQVNYTLQRYRIDQQKLFDDLCENRGQGDKASFSPQSSPRDSASFSCSAGDTVGTRPQDMKTAVRGPGGQLYLTDGHHTFSIFQDFDLPGPDLEVAVVVTHDRSLLANDPYRGAMYFLRAQLWRVVLSFSDCSSMIRLQWQEWQ